MILQGFGPCYWFNLQRDIQIKLFDNNQNKKWNSKNKKII